VHLKKRFARELIREAIANPDAKQTQRAEAADGLSI
jgi:hypothetical protein